MQFDIKFNESEKMRGTILTPYYFNVYGHKEPIQLEVNFSELYEGTYCFAKYGIVQFFVKAENLNIAIKQAIKRLKAINKSINPNLKQIFEISGFKFDENNNKVNYTPSFMENTHIYNRFTSDSFNTKKGDLLVHDMDGDGYGFYYVVNKNNQIISTRLKGCILTGLISDGIIKAKKTI